MLTRKVCECKFGVPFELYGRNGQEQNGIDLFCNSFAICVQCKNYQGGDASNRLLAGLKKDFLSAYTKFGKKMTKYVLATTAQRDTRVQDLTSELSEKYSIDIQVLFWEDFQEILKNNPEIIAEQKSIASSSGKASSAYTKIMCDEDIELFRKICNLFTPSVRYWLSEMDIGGAHPYSVFIGLSEYLYGSYDPFSEFIDMEMEKLRGHLLSAIDLFLSFKAIYTFPKDINGEMYFVTHAWMINHGDFIPHNMSYDEYSVQFAEESQKLNDLATNVWNVYCEFVRQGRYRIAQGQSNA